jgi:hypothetical protein
VSVYIVEHNTLFVHVPKCAGTSMEQSGWLGGGGHHPVWWYENVLIGMDKAFKFAFVRNPWDRFISAFFHAPGITSFERNKEAFRDFVRFIAEKDLSAPGFTYPNISNWPLHHHFLPQWFFICKKDGSVGVDFLGRYENLQEDWELICSRVGVSCPLPHLRNGGHRDYREYYDRETCNIVGRAYERDIDLLGYEFG